MSAAMASNPNKRSRAAMAAGDAPVAAGPILDEAEFTQMNEEMKVSIRDRACQLICRRKGGCERRRGHAAMG